MAGFQAVDLDSILDEFEFKQNEAEKEIKPENSHIYLDKDNKGGTWSQPVSNTYESSQHTIKEVIQPIDTLPPKNEFLSDNSSKKNSMGLSHEPDPTIYTLSQTERNEKEGVMQPERDFDDIETQSSFMSTSTLSAQPDVLSGIEHVIENEEVSVTSVSQEIKDTFTVSTDLDKVKNENSTASNVLLKESKDSTLKPNYKAPFSSSISPNSESTSSTKSQSSPSFESIYDKYRSKETDTDDEKILKSNLQDPIPESNDTKLQNSLVESEEVCDTLNSGDYATLGDAIHDIKKPVSYEPPEVSSEELNDMLEQLGSSGFTKPPDNGVFYETFCTKPTDNGVYETFSYPPYELLGNQNSVGGARPKQTSLMSISDSNICNDTDNVGFDTSEIDSSIKEVQPDVVIVTNADDCMENEDNENLKDDTDPPPYNTIHAMSSASTTLQRTVNDNKFDRPTSLDLEQSACGYSDIENSNIAGNVPAGFNSDENSDNHKRDRGQLSEDKNNDDESEQLVPVVGPPGSTPANPNGPTTAGIPELLQGMSEEQLMLGKVSPFWIPDTEAITCMICETKFTMVKRRHHCRACGKVLCAACCSEKFSLLCLEGKEGRVCTPCKGVLDRLERVEQMSNSLGSDNANAMNISSILHNPSNNGDYSMPHQTGQNSIEIEASGGVAPVSVLKRPDNAVGTPGSAAPATGASGSSGEAKQVMFSDGIRPGGDLTELDGPDPVHRPPKRTGSRGSSKKHRREHREKTNGSASTDSTPLGAKKASVPHVGEVARSMMPAQGLPYVTGQGPVDANVLIQRFEAGIAIPFSLNRNLRVYVTLVKLYSPINKPLWNYKTQGLSSVGQDEIVILLVQNTDEKTPHRNIFDHFQHIYEQAAQGRHFSNMDHSVISGKEFLDGTEYGGFLYIRHTFQCIDDLDLPTQQQQPFLFGILLTKWEMPWARVFPLRLLLRLGAECRYYPSPLWSIRGRNTVYKEIGNTIMKLLSDFRNFTYSLPIIRGMVIHMEDKLTTVIIPKNSYSQIQRALQNSNDPVLALGSNFSSNADSHLVAVQRDEDTPSRNPMNNSDYETQAINIANKSRKVTGASFLVLNGALKSSSGLSAKSSIVEDGIMVQVSQDRMLEIRKSLNKMTDVKINCGPIAASDLDAPDETVYIKWTEKNPSINAGRKSLVDGRPMDGVPSIRMMHGGPDYSSKSHMIRWTEVFMLPSTKEHSDNTTDYTEPPDPSRITSHIAKAISMALLPHLKQLKQEDYSPLAVKVCLDPENTSYEAGSKGVTLPAEFMNNLDNELVPIIHGQSSPSANSYELVFHILDL